jgi:hypothetical protein
MRIDILLTWHNTVRIYLLRRIRKENRLKRINSYIEREIVREASMMKGLIITEFN